MSDFSPALIACCVIYSLFILAIPKWGDIRSRIFPEQSQTEQVSTAAIESSPTSNEAEATESGSPGETQEITVSEPPTDEPPTDEPPTDASAANSAPQPDTYPDAIKRAELAQSLSQSAQSKDDWRLVAGRWQQAIALMEAVPTSSPNYGNVAAKLTDFRRKQAYAQGQAAQPVPTNTQTVVVGGAEETTAAAGNVEDADGDPNASLLEEGPENNLDDNDADNDVANNASGQVHSAPIVRRSGGTPVIQVVFNGEYTVEMIVDTGASGTVITQRVAQSLGVRATGRTRVSTASAQNVDFLLGEVASIKVDGVELQNTVVAIAGPELDTGLLGNDFFGQYDVTVRSDVVEFRER